MENSDRLKGTLFFESLDAALKEVQSEDWHHPCSSAQVLGTSDLGKSTTDLPT